VISRKYNFWRSDRAKKFETSMWGIPLVSQTIDSIFLFWASSLLSPGVNDETTDVMVLVSLDLR